MKKFYAGTALAVIIAALVVTGCPNPAGDDPVYGISLDTTGTYSFPETVTGYEAPTAKTVTVTNTGDQATGKLTITKSGTNAASFTLSPASLDSIAVDGTGTFTVVPKTELAAGTYTADITVSGEHDIAASFAVSFTVSPPETPVYSVDISETGTYAFPPATAGYDPAPAAYSVTVTNMGNRPTGTLTITKSGTNPGSFTVSPGSLDSIAASGTGAFTVAPNTGLTAGTYTATITVGGENSISASFNVSFTVSPPVTPPVYRIVLSEAGPYTFLEVYPGYGPQPAKSLTVTNTGNQATGDLTITKSGTNPGSFTVAPESLGSIAVNGSGGFTIVPASDLTEGTYTAAITVGGANGISASFDVSFTVKPAGAPFYEITLDKSGTYSFPGAIEGYGTPPAVPVQVYNSANQPTGDLDIAISGADSTSFTVSPASLSSIITSTWNSFTVAPIAGLATGTYTATITVSGEHGISESFDVRFEVEAPVYDISLDQTGTYAFPNAAPEYEEQTAKTIHITNEGNQPTGALTITNSGANPGSFTISPASSLSSIGVGGTGSFTVAPVPGLTAGTYTATITVSGGYGISESFDVRFNVIVCTVTFNFYDGGTPVSTVQTGYGGTVSPPNPVRNGYTFHGWYTAPNGGGTAFIAADPVTADLRVYAYWLSANANLGSLSVDAGSLNPAFSPDITAYTVLVPDGTSDITVTAAAADTGKAALSPASPYTANLTTESTLITLTVTAQNDTTAKVYTIRVNKTPAGVTEAVNVAIGIADERIDLTRSTENDLSREAGNTLRLTAPEGYANYIWMVDGGNSYSTISPREIQLYQGNSYSLGTHSVLLEYEKDGIPYGCEILFKVVR
jgi:uncharacterized repeat protein (TIGR02543 family)